MTVQDTHETVATPAIPVPRTTEERPVPAEIRAPAQAATGAETAQATAPVKPPARGEFPWPEPWHYSLGTRPRSEYWDVETATWRSRGPVPPPPGH
jgi:hypothetical protein